LFRYSIEIFTLAETQISCQEFYSTNQRVMLCFLMYIANFVKESGLNQGKWRLLLETKKSVLFHKFHLIAGIGNLLSATAGVD